MRVFVLALTLSQLVAHAPAFAGAGQSTQATAGKPLAFRDLENFTYDLGENASVDDGRVPLVGGRWTDPSEGGSTFTLLPIHAIGDLDRDGNADAAGILLEGTTGTGSFYYLFALANRGGKAEQLGPPEWLGDRSVIQRLTIDRRGIITVRFVTHKDSDPLCCPTLKIEDRFRIEDGKLVGITK
jgi:hypothetical protein